MIESFDEAVFFCSIAISVLKFSNRSVNDFGIRFLRVEIHRKQSLKEVNTNQDRTAAGFVLLDNPAVKTTRDIEFARSHPFSNKKVLAFGAF